MRFAAAVDPAVPIQVTVTPPEATLTPGERLRVTVRASNTAGREVTTRVGHRFEPEAQSSHLALLLCPLFVPVTLEPGESREFSSEYMLLADAPKDLRLLTVTYVFPRNSNATSRRSGGAMAWPVPHHDSPRGESHRTTRHPCALRSAAIVSVPIVHESEEARRRDLAA